MIEYITNVMQMYKKASKYLAEIHLYYEKKLPYDINSIEPVFRQNPENQNPEIDKTTKHKIPNWTKS